MVDWLKTTHMIGCHVNTCSRIQSYSLTVYLSPLFLYGRNVHSQDISSQEKEIPASIQPIHSVSYEWTLW